MRSRFHEHIERYRKLSALGSTIRAPALVDAPQLVDHCTTDAQRGVRLEWDAAAWVETIHSADESDHRRGRDVVTIRQ
jgi:hypothetical protein